MSQVHTQMLNVAVANGLPMAYKNDLLVHDKRGLEEHPGRSFFWLLYENGTHIIWAEPEKGGSKSWSQWSVHSMINTIIDCFTRGRARNKYKWFFCDGKSLIPQLEVEVVERSKKREA